METVFSSQVDTHKPRTSSGAKDCLEKVIHPQAIKAHVKIITFALLLTAMTSLFGNVFSGDLLLWVLGGIWALALLAGLFALIKEHFKSIETGEESVTIKTGILSTKTTFIPYWTITDIDIKQGILDRILGLGTLDINTAGTTQTEIMMVNLRYAELKELLEAFKKRTRGKPHERVERQVRYREEL